MVGREKMTYYTSIYDLWAELERARSTYIGNLLCMTIFAIMNEKVAV